MKLNFTLLLLLLAILNGHTQSVRLTKAYTDSVQSADPETGMQLNALLAYNEAITSFGYDDTIGVFLDGDAYEFDYKGTRFTDITLSMVNPKYPFMLSAGYGERPVVQAVMQQTPSTKFHLFISAASFDENSIVYRLVNFKNDVMYGRYEERIRSGPVLVTGQYCQYDSLYSDTVMYMDPKTYRGTQVIYHRDKYAMKTGGWFFYSPAGILLKEEQHPGCR